MKKALLEKSIRKILNIVAALQRKSETTKSDYNFDSQKSLKGYVSNFSMLLYLKAFKRNVKNAFLSSQNILYLPNFP